MFGVRRRNVARYEAHVAKLDNRSGFSAFGVAAPDKVTLAKKNVDADIHMTKRQENDDALCAQNWLRQQGYRDIRRPCSDPPDFLVDGDCAVEVTRLNQRIVVGDEPRSKGQEQAREPLTDHLGKVLGELGSPGNAGRSWVIDCEYDFTEPLPNRKIVTAQVSEALAPLLKPYDDNVISSIHSRHLDYGKHAGEISPFGNFRISAWSMVSALNLQNFRMILQRSFYRMSRMGKV